MTQHQHRSRCAAHCGEDCPSRRKFLQGAAMIVAGGALGCGTLGVGAGTSYRAIRAHGPAAQCVPVIKAAFVRRKGAYGTRWPGEVWDGEAARARFTQQVTATAHRLRVRLELRPEPIYTAAEADAWLAEAKGADGLLVLLLDRQEHAWPTAAKAADTGIPTVVWSPLGTSFTTNTEKLSTQPGCVIFSTDDARWLDNGLRLLAGGARMRRARAVVIAGTQRKESKLAELGIGLQYVPAKTFIDEYNALAVTPEIAAMANDFMGRARRQHGATRQDVLNGVKSYFVAGRILEREGADAISMDCLGALGKLPVSLPCIAWSRMNDDGIPAACEADLGAVAAHIITQYTLERPGFQQDPVADTADDSVIGAHCSCPTRLRGFEEDPLPFDLIHHHGNRDAVPRTLWPVGERATCLDVLPGDTNAPTELLISAGQVLKNNDVPPSGGCVVSVKIKFDGAQPVLSFPGFHQLFILGDFKRELAAFCQLYKLKGTSV